MWPHRPRQPESYYRPRRDDLTASVAIAGAIVAALMRGGRQWLLIARGVRHHDAAHGLLLYMWQVIEAAVAGAAVGVVMGWVLGFAWERWHRWRRARRSVA
jgi:hypothetical protein